MATISIRPGQTIEGKQSNSIFMPIFDKKLNSKVDPVDKKIELKG